MPGKALIALHLAIRLMARGHQLNDKVCLVVVDTKKRDLTVLDDEERA